MLEHVYALIDHLKLQTYVRQFFLMISSSWNRYGWVLLLYKVDEITLNWFICVFASFQNGPPQYRSSTIFEDASPEVVRDFFWDDEFRIKNSWDDMLLQHETLEECTKTGTLVVRWVRKVSVLHHLSWWLLSSNHGRLLIIDGWFSCAVPVLLQRQGVHHRSQDMGIWKDVLLCDQGIAYKYKLISAACAMIVLTPMFSYPCTQ